MQEKYTLLSFLWLLLPLLEFLSFLFCWVKSCLGAETSSHFISRQLLTQQNKTEETQISSNDQRKRTCFGQFFESNNRFVSRMMQNDSQIRKYSIHNKKKHSQQRKQRKRDCFVALLVLFCRFWRIIWLWKERCCHKKQTKPKRHFFFVFCQSRKKYTHFLSFVANGKCEVISVSKQKKMVFHPITNPRKIRSFVFSWFLLLIFEFLSFLFFGWKAWLEQKYPHTFPHTFPHTSSLSSLFFSLLFVALRPQCSQHVEERWQQKNNKTHKSQSTKGTGQVLMTEDTVFWLFWLDWRFCHSEVVVEVVLDHGAALPVSECCCWCCLLLFVLIACQFPNVVVVLIAFVCSDCFCLFWLLFCCKWIFLVLVCEHSAGKHSNSNLQKCWSQTCACTSATFLGDFHFVSLVSFVSLCLLFLCLLFLCLLFLWYTPFVSLFLVSLFLWSKPLSPFSFVSFFFVSFFFFCLLFPLSPFSFVSFFLCLLVPLSPLFLCLLFLFVSFFLCFLFLWTWQSNNNKPKKEEDGTACGPRNGKQRRLKWWQFTLHVFFCQSICCFVFLFVSFLTVFVFVFVFVMRSKQQCCPRPLYSLLSFFGSKQTNNSDNNTVNKTLTVLFFLIDGKFWRTQVLDCVWEQVLGCVESKFLVVCESKFLIVCESKFLIVCESKFLIVCESKFLIVCESKFLVVESKFLCVSKIVCESKFLVVCENKFLICVRASSWLCENKFLEECNKMRSGVRKLNKCCLTDFQCCVVFDFILVL